jgi:hypothetical protein
MSSYALEVDLNTVAAYPTTPQVLVPFQPDMLMFRVSSGAIDVHVSFDGTQTHVILKSTDINNLQIPCKDKKIWLKQASAGVCKALISAFTAV